jgi:pimeloyl-ACP methyl ester carboxylesterase
MKAVSRVLLVSLLMIGLGGLLAWSVQTDGGQIKIKDIRFVGTNGTVMSALLYVPKNATAKTPAPGVLAVHGYINTRETQDGFAIEFARRGYVVLAMDQTGHGYSDPPAFANGFGGPDGLRFLRSLDIVDKNNIGLEGHSMGGWTVGVAAQLAPNDYKAMVMAGSSTGTSGVTTGTATFPRNLAVVFSKFDEFSQLMWLTPLASDVAKTPKMKLLFNTTEDVKIGQVYGNIADGTARVLYQPAVSHPGDHISNEAIGYALDWFGQTLQGGTPRPSSDQVWLWKEIGNLIAAIGMILLLYPAGAMLLKLPFFGELKQAPAPGKPATGALWWIVALIFVALPASTLFTFKQIPTDQKWVATALFPQNITTAVVTWTTLLGVIFVVLFVLWHFLLNKKTGATAENYGLTWGGKLSPRLIGKSALFAFLTLLAGYVTLLLTDAVFKTDYRFWVFAIKPMSSLQFQMAIPYFVLFAAYFIVASTFVNGILRREKLSFIQELGIALALNVLGYVVLLLTQYVPFFAGGLPANPNEALWTIIAYQFVPLMSIVALITTVANRITGRIWVGAFIVSMLIAWIVVASQATHFAF